MVYLDNAATTYPKPECVYKALDAANRNAFNVGRGGYKVAREASKLQLQVRNKILQLNNIKNANVVYTSSATIALNSIIFGLELKEGDNVYISPFEHNSIIRPLEQLKKEKKINIHILPFDKNTWEVNLEKINNMFAIYRPSVILLSQVSNVTGYMLPYNEIFEIGEKYGAINVLDAAQGYGIVKLTDYTKCNYIVFAGHKSLYGCFGIAGYIKIKQDKLKHTIFGGTGSDTMNTEMSNSMPEGYEAGSPNIVAICGLNESIDWLLNTDVYSHEMELTEYLIEQLKTLRNINLFVPQEQSEIFGIVSIGVEGYSSDDVGKILNEEFDICVRTGYHCAPLIHEFIESSQYNGTVRIALGYFNTKQDIDYLIQALKSL